MKVVLDTNVLVSGLLSPYGPPGEIVRMVSRGLLKLQYDARILLEYREVLGRERFLFNKEKVAILLDFIVEAGTCIAASPLRVALVDKDDSAFLEVAIAAQVPCLITGNGRHFPKRACSGIPVYNPAQFIEYFRRI